MTEQAHAERERIATFGKLEDGLRAAGDWYQWGPYPSYCDLTPADACRRSQEEIPEVL